MWLPGRKYIPMKIFEKSRINTYYEIKISGPEKIKKVTLSDTT